MNVAVVMPYRAGDEYRQRAFHWTTGRFAALGLEPILGRCHPGVSFNRSEAIIDGAERTDAEILIVSDADVWSPGLRAAVEAVQNGAPWAVPHLKLHRLAPEETDRVLAGAEPDVSMRCIDQRDTDSPVRTSNPYKGFAAGTLLVIRRDVVFDVPPDVRFVGWNPEDSAWNWALSTLVAPPWRDTTAPCFHLYHPPAARRSRMFGTDAGETLYRRYRACKGNRDRMRALVDESKAVTAA